MHPAVAQSLFVQRKDNLGPYLIGSAIGHVALVALAIVASMVWGTKLVDLDQKPIKASLVRKGKPRDEKLLPRKEALPPPPAEKPVPVPIPGVAPAEKVAPSPKAAPAAEPKGEDRRKQLFGAFDKTAKPSPAEELEGAEDGDEEGDSAVQEGERYHGLLNSQVRRHYDVSDTIPEAERIRLKAQVLIKIGKAGELLDVKVVRSSGNDIFDGAVVAAVKKAAPFSPPPEHMREDLADKGIVFAFKP